ncbi:Glycosyltransferase involved in cell wall bisynthesis [Devosia crocina]|uniref:Glycosyltransferase involved in cell wall bisynthesis n=1 Tax=Devosia crocina TaxID=429728 RepID=A0A1I7NLI4_9HYPH|nr:glycosyltransferase family 4 protein [Devosia crocina]SFV35525.1 Glycosyltransferase involved in cell wall bisynthesis [Devosia crocina]
MNAAALSQLRASRPAPHILMTVDAVGGVWRYAMDLSQHLAQHGFRLTFAGFGPAPSAAQRIEAESLGRLFWHDDAPLDWLTEDETRLDAIPAILEDIVVADGIDLVHLNLPSQAAGLKLPVPVLAVSHSCVVTWFAAVRGTAVPPDWQWQYRRNRAGFDAADAVLAPSHSHAEMLLASYGPIPGLGVVLNGSSIEPHLQPKQDLVFAAGRWWDDGKNGAVLDSAAAQIAWPVKMAGPQTGPNGQFLPIRHAEALGTLPHGEVANWMSRAAIVASPSRYEPFGLAPLEAARAGAALVLSDIPTYRELWDGAALFASPDDPAAFAQAIDHLSNDAGMRQDYAERARERSLRYTLDAQASAIQAIYEALLHPALVREA